MTSGPDLSALFGGQDVSTFLGLDACPVLSDLTAPAAIISAAGATPYGSVGAYCAGGPAALRRATAAMAANIDRMNFDIGGPIFPAGSVRAVDCGDLPFDPVDFAANRSAIKTAITQIISAPAVPILIGGDDSVQIPMLAAYAATGRQYTILQIDAHIDWRDTHMGENLGLSSTMRRASEMDHITGMVQVGARGIGSAHPDDVVDAQTWGAHIIPAQDYDQGGTATVLDLIPDGTDIIICLDVDALDPAIVPGVIGRAPGGLSYFQTLDLIAGVAKRGRIAGLGVVEYMPEADVSDIGAMTVARIIAASLGIIARQ